MAFLEGLENPIAEGKLWRTAHSPFSPDGTGLALVLRSPGKHTSTQLVDMSGFVRQGRLRVG